MPGCLSLDAKRTQWAETLTICPLTEAEVQQAGFAGLVRQPCDLERLVATIATCLHHPWCPGQPPLVDTAP